MMYIILYKTLSNVKKTNFIYSLTVQIEELIKEFNLPLLSSSIFKSFFIIHFQVSYQALCPLNTTSLIIYLVIIVFHLGNYMIDNKKTLP